MILSVSPAAARLVRWKSHRCKNQDVITETLLTVPFARVEQGDWDWAALGTIATALAVIVTAVTIIFVAKQTSATRKAAQEAERSADAANQALRHSQKQLEYSHQQHQQSLYMATEAIKSRIDAEMPRLVLEETIVHPEVKMEDGTSLPDAFFDPGDRQARISHGIRFRMRNDGPRTAKLRFSEPLLYFKKLADGTDGIQGRSATKDSIPLGIGEALIGEFTLTTQVGFWMDAGATRATGQQPDSYPQFFIRYLTDADTGAHENHSVTLAGEALKPDTNQIGRWHHVTAEVMNGEGSEFGVFQNPVRRMYFASRVRNEPLPDLSWDDVAKTPALINES